MSLKNKRIIFMGTPSFAATVLSRLIEEDYSIIAVVTQADKKVGRKQVLTYSPVKQVALEHQIPVYQPLKISQDYQDLLDLDADLIITCAYGQIIPKALLDAPLYRCINIHGSLLPSGRGGAPIQWSLIHGETSTGITIMYMNEKMDEGDILYQESLDIDEDDTNTTLFEKLSVLASDMIISFLPDFFEGKIQAIPQDHALATYTYTLKKSDEFIRFDRSVKEVYDHIRGLLDQPGAFSVLDGVVYKWISVSYQQDETPTQPGKFCGLEKDYLRIDCLDGFLKVFKLKPEGKNIMDAKSFYNGKGRSILGHYFESEYYG